MGGTANAQRNPRPRDATPGAGGARHRLPRHRCREARIIYSLAAGLPRPSFARRVREGAPWCSCALFLQCPYLVRTADGTVSISVYDNEAGANESTRAAANWIRENLPQLGGSAPQVSAGEVVLSA